MHSAFSSSPHWLGKLTCLDVFIGKVLKRNFFHIAVDRLSLGHKVLSNFLANQECDLMSKEVGVIFRVLGIIMASSHLKERWLRPKQKFLRMQFLLYLPNHLFCCSEKGDSSIS